MNKKYLSILSNLKQEDITTQNPNDKILLIDGLNTFIRAYTVNPTTNDDGIHIGGIGGFFRRLPLIGRIFGRKKQEEITLGQDVEMVEWVSLRQ